MRRSSREPGRTERPTDLQESSATMTGGRHWEACHRGRKLPRLTLIDFGIAVYCGNYACPWHARRVYYGAGLEATKEIPVYTTAGVSAGTDMALALNRIRK